MQIDFGCERATKPRRTTYIGADQKTRSWESMERLTRGKHSEVDAVGILAILAKPTGPEILLQKQFRPPVGKVCVEIPAGLIDEGETAEACAIRELKEESGYRGEVITHDGTTLSPLMFNDPGIVSTSQPCRPDDNADFWRGLQY